MKSAILLAAATSVLAQKDGAAPAGPPKDGIAGLLGGLLGGNGAPKGGLPGMFDPKNCSKEAPPDNIDPMIQFNASTVQWPCDFGKAVPYGKVPTGCAKFEVLVARGTSEGGPFGIVVGDPLIARLIKAMPGQNVRGYPVQYPAGMGGKAAGGKGTDAKDAAGAKGADGKAAAGGAGGISSLLEQFDVGPKDVINRISSQMKECPDERFALVGYSQGGGVIVGAASRLTPQQIDKIDAVVTYGSGGVFPEALRKKWLNNCAPGDFCGGDPGTEGHLSYNNQGTIWHDRSAKYIADAFAGKSQGQIFAKTSRN